LTRGSLPSISSGCSIAELQTEGKILKEVGGPGVWKELKVVPCTEKAGRAPATEMPRQSVSGFCESGDVRFLAPAVSVKI